MRLSGAYCRAPGSDTVVLVVHGLGGATTAGYCIGAASAASRAGYSCLRLALRGADRLGEDFHHAGMVDDVRAALASAQLAHYRRVFVVGYSMGGHIALRAAIEKVDQRIVAVAAICPPLDLAAGQRAIDAPSSWIYRRHVIAGLNEMYAAVAARRPVPTPIERVRMATTLREWDRLTVVPRFDFHDVDDYYTRASVSTHIARLDCPALIIASQHDPMIPAKTLFPAIACAPACLEVRWVRGGGHVYFRPDLNLGMGQEPGVEAQTIAWLSRH